MSENEKGKMEKQLYLRTLSFYILMLTVIAINIYYVEPPVIKMVDIIISLIVTYLYASLLNYTVNSTQNS